MSCCLEDASPIANEGRRALARIRRDPLSIWWQRRQVRCRSSDDGRCDTAGISTSPFPPRWSQTRDGLQSSVQAQAAPDLKGLKGSNDTYVSSIFSTASQEQERANAQHQWDASGFCRRHPRIRLAVKNRRHPVKSSRLKRIFKAGKSSEENEWTVVLPRCPDCEREEGELNNSSPVIFIPPSQNVAYVPIPATLDIISTHSMLPEDTLAIQVRSVPMPRDKISPTDDWCWDTPSSGALDFCVPVDTEGNELAAIACISDGLGDGNASAGEYEYIVERIIPISSIDHVSRGGDAWDILRNSTGENDLGCKCDVKIHGSTGRLLRFDLVAFGDSVSCNGRQHSAAGFGLDFTSSISAITDQCGHCVHTDDRNSHDRIRRNTTEIEKYSTDSVIQMLSSIILWELEVRGSGASGWSSYLVHLFDELCAYGVHEDDPF